MRSLNRNKRKIYYALLDDFSTIFDEYGNETGEAQPIYGSPVELMGNVSASSGEDMAQVFGNFTNYTRILCVADNDCPLAVRSIVWFGIEPTEPHNYIVTRKADSKNGILYALQEVSVT